MTSRPAEARASSNRAGSSRMSIAVAMRGLPSPPLHQLAFSPDGKTLAIGTCGPPKGGKETGDVRLRPVAKLLAGQK
jgi:hypothetical protein